MSKNILIINGHPDPESFCQGIANTYYEASGNSGNKCELINLHELKFNPSLQFGYRKRTELEEDLQKAQKLIKWANHLIFVYPTWWGTYPALLKGFIDRTFLPGFAFKYHKDTVYWSKLLKGKTGHLFVTMDAPQWFYEEVFKQPGHNSMKINILKYCGVKPVKVTSFNSVKDSTRDIREKWLQQVKEIAENQ